MGAGCRGHDGGPGRRLAGPGVTAFWCIAASLAWGERRSMGRATAVGAATARIARAAASERPGVVRWERTAPPSRLDREGCGRDAGDVAKPRPGRGAPASMESPIFACR